MELKDFIENVKEQFDDAPGNFGADTRFRELDEWSSLVSLSIIAMVDDEYDIILKGDDIRKAVTVQDLFEIAKSKE